MKKVLLGNTGLMVSRLCFGGLTMGPLQSNMTAKDGGELLLYGLEKGINFVDTAEIYETYPHIKHALSSCNREDIVIASKSYAYSNETAEASLSKALKEMNTDYVDIFLLHEQESEYTIKGHYEALRYFNKMKEKGYIKAVGISTHTIKAVKAALKIQEIEVLHPIVNIEGLGIQDGSIEEMIDILNQAHDMGKGIYGMKPLGGGNLLKNFEACFDYVLSLDCLDSIAVGMQSKEEIDGNTAIFQGRDIDKVTLEKIRNKTRSLNIDFWCGLCGKCVKTCSHQALEIVNDKLIVNQEKCVLCGYCSKNCPEFCIKVI